MKRTKNNHYLSKTILNNFLCESTSRSFLEYNPISKHLKTRNIDRLFSARRIWGQDFENLLNGNMYENKIGPMLKELASCPVERKKIMTSTGIAEAQFNAEIITDSQIKEYLSKLLLQTILLQRSQMQSDTHDEMILTKFWEAKVKLNLLLLLCEINPNGNYPPLVLTDGMPFSFLCPDKKENSAGHICFMFPITESRFLLWVSYPEDASYFVKIYQNINYLNLCRIEQHDKKCKIALQKNDRNEQYLNYLIQQIPSFSSGSPIQIRATREWK